MSRRTRIVNMSADAERLINAIIEACHESGRPVPEQKDVKFERLAKNHRLLSDIFIKEVRDCTLGCIDLDTCGKYYSAFYYTDFNLVRLTARARFMIRYEMHKPTQVHIFTLEHDYYVTSLPLQKLL